MQIVSWHWAFYHIFRVPWWLLVLKPPSHGPQLPNLYLQWDPNSFFQVRGTLHRMRCGWASQEPLLKPAGQQCCCWGCRSTSCTCSRGGTALLHFVFPLGQWRGECQQGDQGECRKPGCCISLLPHCFAPTLGHPPQATVPPF